MTKRIPDYLPSRINRHVPNMSYAADVIHGGNNRVNFGTPAVKTGLTTAIAATVAITSAVDTTLATAVTADATFGRNVDAVLSGAGTPAIVVYGTDFHGQPMSETLTGNGTTIVEGKKAFYKVTRYTCAAVSGETVSIGWGSELGLPYKATAVLAEIVDDAQAGTTGTLTEGVNTDPQTATTVDPRGTFDPNTTLDGSKEIEAVLVFDDTNLMGVAHYTA